MSDNQKPPEPNAFVALPLQGQYGDGRFTIVDAQDADAWEGCSIWCQPQRLKNYEQFYATVRVGGRRVYLHRVLLGVGQFSVQDVMVDHVNDDGLDNRRSNLRTCSNSQNQAKRRLAVTVETYSTYRGVTWHKQRGRWQAGIKVNQKSLHLGLFDSETEAALAYDRAAIEHFGQFASINFPEGLVA